MGGVRDRCRGGERPSAGGGGLDLPRACRRRRRPGDRGVPTLPRDDRRMIDLKAARNDPDTVRAALARKGAAETFDALLAADERWRELVPEVDELRSRTKLKGKPTPEQLAELQQVKESLRTAEESLAAAEAERDRLALRVPNPPDPGVPDGSTEDDVVELRRVGEPPALESPREHLDIGRFDMERAARMSGARFGFWIGDTARLAL